VKVTSAPFLHASGPSIGRDHLSRRDWTPWIGTEVIITKPGDPFKGVQGIVKDVRGPNVEMQISRHNPSNPYQKLVVNYNDIVTTS
jgi:hypothetical protein